MQFRKLKSLKFLYEINEDGVLRNVKSKKIIEGSIEKNGYRRVRIENKCLNKVIRTSIHRLVAEAFISNPDNKPFVNHKDLNKLNNNVNNLEWVTHSENMKHAYANNVNVEPLRNYSKETRKKVICVEENKTFESVTAAAKWLVSCGKVSNVTSAISGISAVINGKRKTIGGFSWKTI